MAFRPLSQRNNPDPTFDGPHEGIPDWMFQSVVNWIDEAIYEPRGRQTAPSEPLLLAAEASLHVTFDWSSGPFSARMTALDYVKRNGEFGLDFLDFLLSNLRGKMALAAGLNVVLTRAGSAWEVQAVDPPRSFDLVRRAIGPVSEAIDDIRPISQRAHAHLMSAWSKLMGRNPDPSGAYREAIRAVEVVAAPVVIPSDDRATLGTIIGALRDKPEKWTVDLAEATPEQVKDMAAMIWQSQVDRHGTDDESVPLNVSQEQADAAVHISIALVRLFAGGHITRVP
ncbi:MAG TPA: hypothetical protein VGX26_08230 [Solirubrobacteraceae bacterium]|jgi:hypothetical protein|nr:hypothetical protein [Solirubrobacteraceae bacterium]